MAASKNAYLFYCAAVIALGTFQFGYNMAELNEPREAMSCLTADGHKNKTPSPAEPIKAPGYFSDCIPMAPWQYSLVTSIFAAGGLTGALLAGPLTKRYGRRRALFLNALGLTLAGLIKAAAPNVNILAFGRLLSGIGSGAAAVVVPLYLNEIAPKDSEGSFGALTQISINVGILMTQVAGLSLSEPLIWRWILVIGAVCGALQAFLLLSIPESPKYLLSIGDKPGARDALARLRGANASNTIEAEIREEQPLVESDSNREKVSFITFITSPVYRRSALTVCGLMFAQQLTGINAVIFHGVSVLAKLLPNQAGSINVFISLANLLITSIASFFFDRVSHKLLLILSMLGMGTFAFLLAAGLHWYIPILTAVACLMFVSSFSMGLGPLPWMVAGRTVKYEAVDAAQAAGLVVNWIGTFIVAFGVPLVPTQICFVLFGGIGYLSAFLVSWGVEAY
ncbi:vacuolar protein sorting-associated protein 73 [Ascodesmis nigricans]|uniref:Vacuolar protein sorting-associated protein 73 n=1 Tax=Ascodesmis nigricans TaxID=341454 RepID=A0A4S2N3E2_9PEZI|nr:vacuolar protein sorting-associated protein 73 [Ascodesmis nigricans]